MRYETNILQPTGCNSTITYFLRAPSIQFFSSSTVMSRHEIRCSNKFAARKLFLPSCVQRRDKLIIFNRSERTKRSCRIISRIFFGEIRLGGDPRESVRISGSQSPGLIETSFSSDKSVSCSRQLAWPDDFV